MPGRTTRTTQPYDFLELNPGQFEDLMRQLAATSGVEWTRAPEPVGRLGSDHGKDVRVTEQVRARDGTPSGEREWRFQAKRYKEFERADARRVVREAVPDPGDVPYALVVSIACRATDATIAAFHEEAVALGIQHHELWTQDTLTDKLVLNENARIAAFYFGDGPAIDGTVAIPLALDRSPGRDLNLVERAAAAAAVRDATGDVIIVGKPGTGKTRLALEAEYVRFVTPGADPNAVADSLRQHQPDRVVVDDAGLAIERLEMVLELRRAGHEFQVVATVWPESLPEVRRHLREATVVEVGLLERPVMDELLRGLGIGNYYLRIEILDQSGGRPGWAVTLADLAVRGEATTVLSGRALIDEVEPYLKRLGASSAKAFGLLSVIAALGRVRIETELPDVEAFLTLGRLDGQQLLQEAAATGVLESDGEILRVAPNAFRFALVALWFFEQETAPWPIDEVIAKWPSRRGDVVQAVLEAAWRGSLKARAHLETLLGTVADLPYGALEKYVALDEEAAERAIREADSDPQVARSRVEILDTAAKRFALPSAISRLLDTAIGDDRAQHSYPNHPIRILGEVGSRADPHGTTSFEARTRVLETTNAWLDADPRPERQLVWAKVAAHLLTPEAKGNYQDPGSPMKITMQAGWESPAHLNSIATALWPQIAARLGLLDSPSLVAVIDVVGEWIRLARRLEGAFGAKPSPEQAAMARTFLDELLPSLRDAADAKPSAQIALQETARLLRVGLRLKIDPEFRLLSWPWRMYRPGKDRHVRRAVDRLVDCWATEEPPDLMARVAGWSIEASRRNRTLDPMIHIAFETLAQRIEDVDPLISAGFKAGLSGEMNSLFRASVSRKDRVPDWFEPALAGSARWPILLAALAPDSPNEAAAQAAIDALSATDAQLVETVVIQHGHSGHGWVSRAVLRHPIEAVRGQASLWFGLDSTDYAIALPDDWYEDWKAAFVLAPNESARGNNYRLGEVLSRLVARDPDLVESWVAHQLEIDPDHAMFNLPDQAGASFPNLPREHRGRMIRMRQGRWNDWQMLELLLGEDMEWLESLLDEGVVGTDDVYMTLNHSELEPADRVARLLMLAPILVRRGTDPREVAGTAHLGSWMGDRSAHYERIREAFDTAPPGDEYVEAVREAGIDTFAKARDKALREEHERRITGEL